MTGGRWLIPVGVAASILLVASVAVTVWPNRDEPFEPSASSYLELACGIHRHQQDLSRAEIERDEAERELGYAVSTLLLEVGNRRLEPRLQDLSHRLKTALDKDDDELYAKTRDRVDDECDGYGELTPDPERLVDIACAVAGKLPPGPGPEVLLTSELLYAAAANDKQYDDLAKAAARLVINPEDFMDSDHPDKGDIAEFQRTCSRADAT